MTEQGALAGAFMLGLFSAAGPCAAPRYVLFALQLGSGVRLSALSIFAAGALGGYLAIAFAGVGLGALGVGSHVVYAALAVAMLACGARLLILDSHARCRAHAAVERASGTLTSAFLGGAASSLVVSPCCTPVVFAIGMQAVQHGTTFAVLILGAFGSGHLLPLLFATAVARSRLNGRWLPPDASATVNGSVLVAIGGLYALLA